MTGNWCLGSSTHVKVDCFDIWKPRCCCKSARVELHCVLMQAFRRLQSVQANVKRSRVWDSRTSYTHRRESHILDRHLPSITKSNEWYFVDRWQLPLCLRKYLLNIRCLVCCCNYNGLMVDDDKPNTFTKSITKKRRNIQQKSQLFAILASATTSNFKKVAWPDDTGQRRAF